MTMMMMMMMMMYTADFLIRRRMLSNHQGRWTEDQCISASGASACSLELNGTTLSPITKYNAEPISLHSLKSRMAFDLVRAHSSNG